MCQVLVGKFAAIRGASNDIPLNLVETWGLGSYYGGGRRDRKRRGILGRC
jgi:hypothetical protein